jgi:transposase
MAAGIAITRKDLSARQLRSAAAKAKDGRSARRMLAIALVLEGADRKTAAETCGMDRQTLRDWVHRYNAAGLSGLSNRASPGRQPWLTPAQKAELALLVEQGPDPERDGVVRWRRKDLKRRIEAMFGVVMQERTVGAQLAELGFGRLTVRPQHPKADETAQEAFKKTSPTRSPGQSRRRRAASRSRSGSRTVRREEIVDGPTISCRTASASKAR